MRTFTEPDDRVARFTEELESALLAQALAGTGGLPDDRMKSLLQCWLIGVLNASAAALISLGEGRGELAWRPEQDGYCLTWLSPTGLACPLARIYQEDNGSWAALIVAGVRDDVSEAMLAAEWGVARLTSS